MGALVLAAAAVARGLVPRFALIGGAREIGSLAGSAMAPKEAENVKQLRLKTGSVTRCARSLAPQRQRLPAEPLPARLRSRSPSAAARLQVHQGSEHERA